MKKRIRQFLSIFLSFIIVIQFFPMEVLAADGTNAPSILVQTGVTGNQPEHEAIQEDVTYYETSFDGETPAVTVFISDVENGLTDVFVDETKQPLDNSQQKTLKLTSDNYVKTYTISALDNEGNVTTENITIAAAWTKTGLKKKVDVVNIDNSHITNTTSGYNPLKEYEYEETATFTFEAEEGYYFPTDYVSGAATVEGGKTDSLAITRKSDSEIAVEYYVSDEPASEIEITLPAATKKEEESETIEAASIISDENLSSVAISETNGINDVSIMYLGAPANPYTLEGTKGKNGFYTSKVKVKPADGYTISKTQDGTYEDILEYDTSISETQIYLKDGSEAITEITLEEINIDKEAPVIQIEDGIVIDNYDPVTPVESVYVGVEDKKTYYKDSATLRISDLNNNFVTLQSISVNGKVDSKSDNPLEWLLPKEVELPSNNYVTPYHIIAEDEAGNTTEVNIKVAAEWTETGLTKKVTVVNTADRHITNTTSGYDPLKEYEYGETATFTFEAGEGYYFPTDYALGNAEITGEGGDLESLTITRESFSEITVKYNVGDEPASEIKITLPSATKKGEGSGTIEVANIKYGKKPSPVLKSETNGINDVLIEYKEKGAANSTYTIEEPTEIGDYTARATFPETGKYFGFKETADFSISYLDTPDNPYTLSGTKGENGFYTSKVKVTPAEGYTISKTLTSDGSTYVDSLEYDTSISGAQIYLRNKSGELTDAIALEDINIDKEAPVLETVDNEIDPDEEGTLNPSDSDPVYVNVENGETYYGDSVYVTVSDSNLQSVTVNGVDQSITDNTKVLNLTSNNYVTDYSITAEDKAGNKTTVDIKVAAPWTETGLTKKVTVVNTDSSHITNTTSGYEPLSEYEYGETATFTFKAGEGYYFPTDYASGAATVEGGKTDSLTITRNSYTEITVEYYVSDEPASEIKITLPETAKKENGSGTIEVANIKYGGKLSPVVKSETNEIADAVIEYKEKGAADSTYTTKEPTKVGEYTARVTFPEADEYFGFEETADFSISYLDAPDRPYTISGTEGENGFYTSKVKVTPAEGYTISATLDGTYVSYLEYDATMNEGNIYLKKVATGEKTSAVSLDKFTIDMDAPSMDVADGKTYFGETIDVTISDNNLQMITVNGEEIELNSNSEKISLQAYGGETEYKIEVVDIAGNTTTINVIVASDWTKTGSIPSGSPVKLKTGKPYIFGSGEWKVSGDSTVYSGDMSFYVKEGGAYTFTKQ